MKRVLFAIALTVTFSGASAVQAQSRDPHANLRAYAAKVLPRCPAAAITVEPMTAAGPANFKSYLVTLNSSDDTCGARKYLLHSPNSQQVLIGSVIPLPNDKRPIAARVTQEASRLLGKPYTANIAPFPLADGLRAVAISRLTPYGAFSYNGFIDAGEQFLIVGFRGSLNSDPAKTLRETLGAANAARRGNAEAKVEVLEISDFQCPTCARAHEKIEPIIQQNLAKMNYVRVDLPLFEHHEWSVPAAMGARALQKVAPAKYWAYVDYVFKNQEAIGKRKIDDVVKEWMEDNDVDWAAVSKIYNSKSERQALLDHISRAFGLGIAATPTFVVNGQIMGFGPDGSFTVNAIKSAVGATTAPAKKPAK